MEAPKPTEEIKQKDSYKIISNKNHSFNLIFQNLNSIIGISASYQDDIIMHNYDKKVTLKEFKENKYFLLCETIDEIYNELIRLMKNNQTKIIEETNQINIIIPVEYIKIKEILIVINEITKNDSEKINELFSMISNMKQEIKELKEKIEITNLKEENEILKEEIKNMKEKNLKEMKDLKEELKKEINKINENKEKEIEELKKEINKINENKEKEIEDLKKKLMK